ncbi:MAG: hypothetical protein H8E81_06090 [Deltaproteobacteria bacterium]|nr:hypothetical protein [Deltaproteobacteria bacterium]
MGSVATFLTNLAWVNVALGDSGGGEAQETKKAPIQNRSKMGVVRDIENIYRSLLFVMMAEGFEVHEAHIEIHF